MDSPLRIGFVPGVMPDKWIRTWRERHPDSPIEPVPLDEETDARAAVTDGAVDMCFLRLPIDTEGLHLVRLYEELSVVVVEVEHPLAAYDEVTVADLVDEQLVLGEIPDWESIRTTSPLDFPPMSTRQAIEVAASGTGIVVVPMSLARLHHRKDAVHRVVTDLPGHPVGLAWPRAVEDDRLQEFVGIVRGRTANSSRGQAPATREPAPKAAPKRAPARKGSRQRRGRR
ncbi:LysR substrate-binding domain-containing protein [Nocardioides sp. AE5]|uniref:LysR substrate-binding domain-containing protein n=1 Tax=Nocardioides sp. AE5 TaxID=2962573 RepID=UPI0028814873|nr:LysR substrate-binding domain-containing protein [Nocardioides sp. AE5]MDT0203583.1 LysR substrate-binding domain-containing protein [Nocardioides sp. AE5]